MAENSSSSRFAFLSNMQTKHKYAVAGGVGVVAIVGITLGVVFGTQSSEEDPTCRSFTAPYGVTFTEQEEGLLLNWSSPSNSRGCTVKYQISYSIDGGNEVVEEVNEANYLFDVSVLEPCTEIEVELVALTESGTESEAVNASYAIAVTTDFLYVSHIRLSDSEQELSAEWDIPTGFNKCQMLYKLEVGATTKITGDAFYKFSDVVLEYCKTTTVFVIPIANEIEGIRREGEIEPVVEKNFGLVHDISLSSEDGKTEISWTAPAGFKSCTIKYNVKFYDSFWLGGEQDVEDLEVAVFDFAPVKCKNITMFVTPTIGDVVGIENSAFYIEPVVEGFGKINGIEWIIQEEVLSAYWEYPADHDYCPITYLVTIGEDVYETSTRSYTFSNTSLKYCDDTPITASILPTVDGVPGLPEVVSYEEPVSSYFIGIEQLTLTEVDDRLQVAWEVTQEYTECDMSFEVQVNEDPVIPTNNAEIFLDGPLEKCFEYNVVVTPVIGEFRGAWRSEIHSVGVVENFAPVDNLLLDYSNSDLTVTWEPPLDYKTCQLTYRIELNFEYVLEASTATSIFIPGFKLMKCAENEVKITPVVAYKAGVPISQILEPPVEAGFNLVKNLAVNIDMFDTFNAIWEMAVEYSNCLVEYEIQLDSKVMGTVDEELYRFEEALESCREHEVKVTPIIDGVRGYEKILNYYSVPEVVTSVTNPEIVVDRDADTFKVIWERPEYLDLCVLSYEVVIIVDGEDIDREIVETMEWTSERPFSYYCYAEGVSVAIYAVYGNVPNTVYYLYENCS